MEDKIFDNDINAGLWLAKETPPEIEPRDVNGPGSPDSLWPTVRDILEQQGISNGNSVPTSPVTGDNNTGNSSKIGPYIPDQNGIIAEPYYVIGNDDGKKVLPAPAIPRDPSTQLHTNEWINVPRDENGKISLPGSSGTSTVTGNGGGNGRIEEPYYVTGNGGGNGRITDPHYGTGNGGGNGRITDPHYGTGNGGGNEIIEEPYYVIGNDGGKKVLPAPAPRLNEKLEPVPLKQSNSSTEQPDISVTRVPTENINAQPTIVQKEDGGYELQIPEFQTGPHKIDLNKQPLEIKAEPEIIEPTWKPIDPRDIQLRDGSLGNKAADDKAADDKAADDKAADDKAADDKAADDKAADDKAADDKAADDKAADDKPENSNPTPTPDGTGPDGPLPGEGPSVPVYPITTEGGQQANKAYSDNQQVIKDKIASSPYKKGETPKDALGRLEKDWTTDNGVKTIGEMNTLCDQMSQALSDMEAAATKVSDIHVELIEETTREG